MNSSGNKLGILLDTTYILPIVGIRVKGIEETLEVLRDLRAGNLVELYYTPFNVLETLGILARRGYREDVVSTGLLLVNEWFKLVHPTIEGYLKVLRLRSAGFRDLVDLLLYATALTNNLLFLTRDKELIEFLKRMGEDLGSIIYEEEFLDKYRDLLESR